MAQHRAIEAMMVAKSITDAAAMAGVSRRSLTRWLANETFCAALRQAETDVLRGLSRRLVSLAATSLDVMNDVLVGEDQSPTLRLKAAEVVLSKLISLKELVDFEQRLMALETAYHETQEEVNQA